MQLKPTKERGTDYHRFTDFGWTPSGFKTEFDFSDNENKNVSVTDSLRREHEDIKRMLKILVNFCVKLDRHEPIRVDDLERILDFLRIYADARHNGKEENLLYPEFIAEGGDRERKMVASVFAEHETERMYVSVIGQMIRHYRENMPNAGTWLVVNLSKYISLQKIHIEKENSILFSMVEKHLAARKKTGLLHAFKCADETGFGAVRYNEFQSLLAYLESNYKHSGPAHYH